MRWAAIITATAAIVLVGLGAALVAAAASSLSETRIGDTRAAVPGGRTVELKHRKYVLFYEVDGDAVADGDGTGPADIPVPPNVAVRIAPAVEGSPALALDSYSTEFTVESGGRSAVAINTVEVPRAGAYRVQATGPQAESEPAVVLGEPSRGRVLRLVLGIGVLGVGVLAAITALVLAILLRRRRRAT
jgi:hypothetical protein